MKAMVVGVFALASALVREREDAFRDWSARVDESQTAMLPRVVNADVGDAPTVGVRSERGSATDEVGSGTVAEATGMSQEPSSDTAGDVSSDRSSDRSSDSSWPRGQWQIACEIKSGSALVFDRASLREYGTMTLFRWSAPRTRIAGPGEQIFTAVVNCREKTIEAAWPGRRRETYVGTCGRGLVEAVCAASEQAAGPSRTRAGQSGASHAGGPPPRR